MASPILFVETAPKIEQCGGVVILTAVTGGEAHSFALPLHAARAMIEGCRRKLDEIDRNLCELVELHPRPPAKPRRRKSTEGAKA